LSMHKQKVLAVLFVILLLASGCRRAEVAVDGEDISTADTRDADTGLVAFYNQRSFSSSFAATPDGYYEYYWWPPELYDSEDWRFELNYANLLYTDYRTSSRVFLCSAPGCRHNSDSCTAFITFTGSLQLVTNSTGTKVFLISSGDGDEQKTEEKYMATIWSMNVDGSEKQALFHLQPNEVFLYCPIFADQTNLYLTVMTVDSEMRETVTELRKFNTEDLTSQTALTLESGMSADAAFGEYIFLTEYKEDFRVFYRYSLSTGSMTKVYTLDVPDPFNPPAFMLQGKYLFIAKYEETGRTGSLTVADLVDGNMRLITGIPMNPDDMPFLSDCFDDKLQWTYADADGQELTYFIDLEKLTFWERTLTFYNSYADRNQNVLIAADAGDEYLVMCDLQDSSITVHSTDGIAYVFHDDSVVYALIDKEDFYNNVPDYRLITDLVT